MMLPTANKGVLVEGLKVAVLNTKADIQTYFARIQANEKRKAEDRLINKEVCSDEFKKSIPIRPTVLVILPLYNYFKSIQVSITGVGRYRIIYFKKSKLHGCLRGTNLFQSILQHNRQRCRKGSSCIDKYLYQFRFIIWFHLSKYAYK